MRNTIVIHESKNSTKVIKFINEDDLSNYCSKQYAAKILKAQNDGDLFGCYLTKSGKAKFNH